MVLDKGCLDIDMFWTIAHHCDPLCQDEKQVTPFHLASQNGYLDVVRYLAYSTIVRHGNPLAKSNILMTHHFTLLHQLVN